MQINLLPKPFSLKLKASDIILIFCKLRCSDSRNNIFSIHLICVFLYGEKKNGKILTRLTVLFRLQLQFT